MKLLIRPLRVFVICMSLAVFSLLANGTVFQLYRMHRDQRLIQEQIRATRVAILDLDKNLKLAKDPVFIERQALDNYDLVEENDLMFVFSD